MFFSGDAMISVPADPRLVETPLVEVLDAPEVPVDRGGGAHPRGVEGAEAQGARRSAARR
jgi:hypothetical protein